MLLCLAMLAVRSMKFTVQIQLGIKTNMTDHPAVELYHAGASHCYITKLKQKLVCRLITNACVLRNVSPVLV